MAKKGYYDRSGSFSLSLKAFEKKVGINIDAVVRKVEIDVATRIVERSPVGDATLWSSPPPPGYVGGRFRANWQAAQNMMPSGELDDIDPSGQVSIDRIIAAIPVKAAGGLFMIANNLPYAQRLEDGWSSQAPAGMVHLTVIEYQQIVREAAMAVNK